MKRWQDSLIHLLKLIDVTDSIRVFQCRGHDWFVYLI